MMLVLSNNSLYSGTYTLNCKNAIIYSNKFGVTIAENAKVDTFENISFK